MTSLTPADYGTWLQSLKDQIRSARLKASLAVNRELVLLYWHLGKEILDRQSREGWGTKVVEQLGRDLRAEFPDMRGLSPRNLKYMRAFAEAWPEEPFVQQLAAQIPWFHNCTLLDQVKGRPTREWYIRKTIGNGWSRSVLEMQIESQAHRRVGAAQTNFDRTLPAPQSDLDLVRDPAHDGSTIGLILCKSKKHTKVSYALRGIATPMGVSTYRTSPGLPKELEGVLPSIEALATELDAGGGEEISEE